MKRLFSSPEVIAAVITVVGTFLVSTILSYLEGRVGFTTVVTILAAIFLILLLTFLYMRTGPRVTVGAAAVMLAAGFLVFLIFGRRQQISKSPITPVARAGATITSPMLVTAIAPSVLAETPSVSTTHAPLPTEIPSSPVGTQLPTTEAPSPSATSVLTASATVTATLLDVSGGKMNVNHLYIDDALLARFDLPEKRVVSRGFGTLAPVFFHWPVHMKNFDLAVPFVCIQSVVIDQKTGKSELKYMWGGREIIASGKTPSFELHAKAETGDVTLSSAKIQEISFGSISSKCIEEAAKVGITATMTFADNTTMEVSDLKRQYYGEVLSPGYGIPVFWTDRYHNEPNLEYLVGEIQVKTGFDEIARIEFEQEGKVKVILKNGVQQDGKLNEADGFTAVSDKGRILVTTEHPLKVILF